MPKISRTRLLAAAFGCLAITAASVSLADDQPTATQPGQPAASALDPAGAALPPAASPATERPKTDQTPSSTQPALDSQPSASSTSQGSDAAKSKASGANEWPSPRRYDPNNPQGGSLGVNIVNDVGGIVIASVRSGTPAQQMGLRRGDRIKSLNGQPIEAVEQFISLVRSAKAGDDVAIEIVRDDAPNTLRGKLEAFGQALARGPGLDSDNEPGMGRFSNRRGDNAGNPNVQTSYEERNSSGRSSGDVEQRLSNLERRLDKLQQAVFELRTAIGNRPSSSTTSTIGPSTSLQTPGASAIESPSSSAPSVLQSTPGTAEQPPSSK
jgi:membrane-associated protease RseP (regulator of RpoE activity)